MKILFLVGIFLFAVLSFTQVDNSNQDDFSVLDNLSTPDEDNTNTPPTTAEKVDGQVENVPMVPTPDPQDIEIPEQVVTPTPAPSMKTAPRTSEPPAELEKVDTTQMETESENEAETETEVVEKPSSPKTENTTAAKTLKSPDNSAPTWEQERYEHDLKLMEVNLFNDDIMLTEKNAKTGLYTNQHNTSNDYLRFTFQYQFNPNVELNQFNKIAAIQSLEFQIAQNVFPFWRAFFFGLSNFDLTQTTDLKFSDEKYEAMISFGGGVSYRFRLFQNYFEDERYFETVHVFATYNMLNLTQTNEYYTGVGFRAEFGAHKRVNIRNHLGIKFAYHLAPLAENTQRKKQMTLSWVSFGVDWSYYF